MGKKREGRMPKLSKRGQVTIFVIVAIVIVAAVILVFAFRGNLFGSSIPGEFVPVYDYYTSCIEQEAELALDILESQGGKIDAGDYVLGSSYAPFSSHLNFAGISIPYWYYVSGNNLIKEQAPTISEMENEMNSFIESRLNGCDLEQFYEQGFYIELSDPDVETKIEDNQVKVDVNAEIIVTRDSNSARKTEHEVIVESKLGKLYNTAKEIYDKQKSDAFLEEYAIDTLRLNAPVDGVEIQCSPEIWQTQEVVSELQNALEANIAAIKFDGDYYRLNSDENNYFVVDLPVDESVNLIYSRDWPSRIEVVPADDQLMMAEPVGNQQGLGAMGFCYVPYHFVYDVYFPVLIQVSDGFEIFQFPVSVIVDNNLPREAQFLSIAEPEEYDLCAFDAGEVKVSTFDVNLNPVEAEISFQCLDNSCNLGSTKISGNGASLTTSIPICTNGKLVARAEGYIDSEETFSSNSELTKDIILDREYEIDTNLMISGRDSGESIGIINFRRDDGYTQTAVFPGNNKVKLAEGNYEIDAQVYGESAITIPASSTTQCVDAARGGILGIFGATEEECFDIEIPATTIDSALIAGGKSSTYILESELAEGSATISLNQLPVPNSLEQLQYNYQSAESERVDISFT